MRITVFIHGSRESCYLAGEQAGLSGKSLARFSYAADEHEIEYEVDEGGMATAVLFDGRKIEPKKTS